MNSTIIITASAVFLCVVGLVLNFLPQEAAAELGLAGAPAAILLLQLLSAALLGMGFVNWLSRSSPMGGIYSRPLAMGNVILFSVGGISLVRASLHGSVPTIQPGPIYAAAILFSVFALGFFWLIFFNDPVSNAKKQ